MSKTLRVIATILLPSTIASATNGADPVEDRVTRITVTVNRGQDVGQNFGSLFEVTAKDSSLVIGAGFQGHYNTRYRGDRHALQFFVRPADGKRSFKVDKLPRPNELCGTYLFGRDGVVHSTYGDPKAWNAKAGKWQLCKDIGGTRETMRVGNSVLEFGSSRVTYKGKTILAPPKAGRYQLFFYAKGYLCFYHVNRGKRGYRPYANDADGFSKLYAVPWTSAEATVDLTRAVTLTLPVVGETTFAWGQFGKQIVTGSNIGGFYVFEEGRWKTLLKPKLGESYQLYSTMQYYDQLLMGQYPTGRFFAYDGKRIRDLAGWPPRLKGVSPNAREAQTTVIYGGDVLVGVWPWAELWRYNRDSKSWTFMRRMFDHPSLTAKTTHPYDIENRSASVANQWGQRITSLVTNGTDLFVATSAKWPCVWDSKKYSFLAPDKWKSYGSVYRLSMPGHLSATTRWTSHSTRFEFKIRGTRIAITQDDRTLATGTLTDSIAKKIRQLGGWKNVSWGRGIYGRFGGKSIVGSITHH